MTRLATWMGACALATLLAAPTSADTFFSDGFDYTDGTLTITDGTGDNVSGGRWQPHSGIGFNDDLDVIGGQVEILNSGSEDANRLAGRTMGAGETWYYAAVFTVNDLRSDPSTQAVNNDYFLHFKADDTINFRTRTWLRDPNVASPDTYTLQLSATSFNAAQPTWPTDLNFGQEYAIVASYSINTGMTQLWVDPVDMASPSITHTVAAAGLTQITSLALRQDFIAPPMQGDPGVPNNQILINAVAMGDDFDSVLANAVNGANIPEPGSMALLMLGGFAWAIARRKS